MRTINVLITLLIGTTVSILPDVAVFAAGDEAAGVAAHPTTHEDIWLMRRLGTPVPSPDGRWAVVSVTEPSYDAEEAVSDLWIVAVDGTLPPRRLTSTSGSEDGAVWSPDGGRLAFSAKRGDDEASQIYVLDMTGPGEAVRITSISTGARAPKWGPDGRRLSFESRVYPGTVDDAANQEEQKLRDERQFHVSTYDTFPVRRWDHWRDDRQVHLFVQDAEPGAMAIDLLAGTALVAEPGYAGVPTLASDELEAEWTPDGEALVFAATVNLHEAARAPTYHHLYRVSAERGEPQRLTASEDWTCHAPRFAPDGSALYCLFEAVNDYAYNLTRLARLPWPLTETVTAKPEIVAASLDRSIGDFEIGESGETLYLTAQDEGRVRIFGVPAKGGDASPLDGGSRGVFAGLRMARGHLVARWEDSTHSAEVVRVDPQTGEQTPLTSFNTERSAAIDRQPFRELWTKTSKGRRIHSWLALPPGFDETKKYPLVLFIHGGPHSSSLDTDHVRWSPHLLAAPGYVVLMTDYTGSVGYGEAFSQAIQGDPLRTPGEELLEVADEALRRFPFLDGARQAAAGASYGGHLVNWLQATTDRFRALVGHAGLVDLEGQWATSDGIYHREINNGGPPWGDSPVWREQSPSTYAAHFRTPVLLTIGEKDYRVPLNQTLAAWSYLQRREVPSRLVVFHEANHWIMKGPDARHFWEEVHAWLGKYLGAEDEVEAQPKAELGVAGGPR